MRQSAFGNAISSATSPASWGGPPVIRKEGETFVGCSKDLID
jgi:hypothetical protein